MRAIIVLGLVWSIVICATPGLADRYVVNPHPAAGQSKANQDHAAQARVLHASDVHVACHQADFNRGKLDDTGNRAEDALVMSARYDPVTDNPFERTMTGPQIEPNSTGLCR